MGWINKAFKKIDEFFGIDNSDDPHFLVEESIALQKKKNRTGKLSKKEEKRLAEINSKLDQPRDD